MTENSEQNYNPHKSWFVITMLFLIFDYGRPQSILPIGFLRPQMVLTIVLIIYIILSRKFSLANSRQMTLIWIFIGILAIHVPLAINNYYAFQTTQTMFLYMPFILSLIILTDTMERLKQVIFIFIFLMAWVSFYGLTHGGVGPGNYFNDENDLSLYINMWLPFCYFLFSVEENRIKKIILVAGLLIGLLAVVVSFSRGGFVGLLAMFFVVWFFSKHKLATIGVLIVLALIVYLFADPAYWQDMGTITDTGESTASQRLLSWEASWKMFLDHPFGVGGRNFPILFPEYQPDELSRNMWGRVAHSLWFTLIPEMGIPGTLVYFLLIFTNLKSVFFLKNLYNRFSDNPDINYIHNLGLAFLASFAGFFASATFVSVLYYAHFWYITGLLVAIVKIARKISGETGDYAELPEESQSSYQEGTV